MAAVAVVVGNLWRRDKGGGGGDKLKVNGGDLVGVSWGEMRIEDWELGVNSTGMLSKLFSRFFVVKIRTPKGP
uniref:Uncharacterized protein n=1 Tax=Vespula pensylvanica TaxID=30213 RepID=A0A834NZN1_VESPE|nr:hypothetical protein H0235_009993 [Vespula pensylvanica]